MSYFPFELLLLILHHVDQKKDLYAWALVNKSLYTETMPLLWRQFDIDSEATLLKISTVMAASPHLPGHHVRSVCLALGPRPWLSNETLLGFIQHVPLLEHLQLKHAYHITDVSLQHVPRHCPHLTSLSVIESNITLMSMCAFGQYCHQLDSLTLQGAPHLDYSKLFPVLQACPLKKININNI